jgi:anti-anti-sigma factor
MTNNRSNPHDRSRKAPGTQFSGSQAEPSLDQQFIAAERCGNWAPAEELRETALAALDRGGDVILSLERIEHLDASALQILLALDAEQKRRKLNFMLANASSHLLEWFEFAGVADRFSMTDRKNDS